MKIIRSCASCKVKNGCDNFKSLTNQEKIEYGQNGLIHPDCPLEDATDRMLPEVAKKVLNARDAFIEEDMDEVWHWIYSIASPNYDKLSHEVWTELENLAKGE